MVALKLLLLGAAASSGVSALIGRSTWRRRRLLILCYHGISLADEHEASPELYLPVELFRRRLERLRARACRVLPLPEALTKLRERTLPPRSVAVTFDDGTRDFAECALALLRAYDVPATLYLSTYYCGRRQPIFDTALRYLLWRGRSTGADLREVAGVRSPLPLDTEAARQRAWDALFARATDDGLGTDAKDALLGTVADRVGMDYERFRAGGQFQVMTPDQVRSLPRDLVRIELHTHRHRAPRDRDAFAREIEDNRAHLAALNVDDALHFCYPGGDYRAEFPAWLRALGVDSATTCVPGYAGPHTDPMLLPRFVDTCGVADAVFDGWLDGAAAALPRRRANRFDPDRLRPAPAAPPALTTPSSSSAAGSPSVRTAPASSCS